jgi:hypothetical protein
MKSVFTVTSGFLPSTRLVSANAIFTALSVVAAVLLLALVGNVGLSHLPTNNIA